MRMNKGKQTQGGFSLVEIIIAIAVIGIMAAAAVPLIGEQMQKAKMSRAHDEMNQIRDALTGLYADLEVKPGTVGNAVCEAAPNTNPVANTPPAFLQSIAVADAANVSPDATPELESLDIHLSNLACGGIYQTTSVLRNALWKGPYLNEPNYADPWGRAAVVQVNPAAAQNIDMRVAAEGSVSSNADVANLFTANNGTPNTGAIFLNVDFQ